MKIGYIFVIAELFHFGHLQLIMAAKDACDRLICGVLTDEAVEAFRPPPITIYNERKNVLEAIRYIDEVIPQHTQNPAENLKQIGKQYANDELIFIYGENWEQQPASEYISSSGIKVIKHRFYKPLSNEKILLKTLIDRLPDQYAFDTFTSGFAVRDFEKFDAKKESLLVTTKANTLQTLKPLLRRFFIEKTFVFKVTDWQRHRGDILDTINDSFPETTIIVRSSALNEDSQDKSMAGHYRSVLNVATNDREKVSWAIDQVIASYDSMDRLFQLNQILIQKQTTDIWISGVLLTRDLESNAPYYVINYDKGHKTDIVTAGYGGRMIKIFRDTNLSQLGTPWNKLISAVTELEQIIQDYSLDIEFAITNKNKLVLFQVRPLAANRNAEEIDPNAIDRNLLEAENEYLNIFNSISPSSSVKLVFSDMLFWNPAELIGHRPSNLAYSIFDLLIMKKAWNQGLVPIGYPNLYPQKLMDRFLLKPYINVNTAFMVTIPNAISPALRSRLLPYFIEKLQKFPFLHDKAEFEIMFSTYDFNIQNRLQELTSYNFSGKEIKRIEIGLIHFTRELLDNYNSIANELSNKTEKLEKFNKKPLTVLNEQVRSSRNLNIVKEMLRNCEEYGTLPFVTAARLAFVADALFRSLETIKVINRDERWCIMNSFSTIASELTESIEALSNGSILYEQFIERYGHLRSGTYDIEQPRYDHFFDKTSQISIAKPVTKSVEIPEHIKNRISRFTLQSPLKIDFDTLYDFANIFIQKREHIKFVYTKTISNLLEIIKVAGGMLGFTANDLSYLNIEQIINLFNTKTEKIMPRIKSQKKALSKSSKTILPPLIFSQKDFRIQHYPMTSPNFITNSTAEGDTIHLKSGVDPDLKQVNQKIVLIENADPGFHWIFAADIRGLITKYGGVCSHMAICCAEFNIPAAIGCGEKFDRFKKYDRMLLDCAGQHITEKPA